jgi:hypothetical protein
LFNAEGLGGFERDEVRHVGVVTGCLLLMTAELWDQLGGFDPLFFMYGEDVDLCRRALDAGCAPAITPAAVAIHAGGASSTTTAKTVMVLRGKATLYRKYGNGLTWQLSKALLYAGVLVRAGASLLTRSARGNVWAEAWRARSSWRSGWTTASMVEPRIITIDPGARP